MSTEKFTFHAGTGVAHHQEEEGLMLIGANLDSSVKWVAAPKGLKQTKEGEKIYVKRVEIIEIAPSIKAQCLVLNKNIDGKQLIVFEQDKEYKFALL